MIVLIEYLTVILEYINFIGKGTANFWLGPPLVTTLKQGTQLIFKFTHIVTLVNWNTVQGWIQHFLGDAASQAEMTDVQS